MKVALVAALAFVSLAAAASAAAPPEQKWIDKPDGFSVILPARWYVVPRSTAAVSRVIAAAWKAKNTGLASA
jgi:hypothetical protein